MCSARHKHINGPFRSLGELATLANKGTFIMHVSNLHSRRFAIEVYSLNKNVLLHTQWGETAVYSASFNGHSEVVKLLVQAGGQGLI